MEPEHQVDQRRYSDAPNVRRYEATTLGAVTVSQKPAHPSSRF